MANLTPVSPRRKFHDAVVEVPLSQGKVALIDAADAERVLAFKWSAMCPHPGRKRPIWYAMRHDYSTSPPTGIYLHRFILGAGPGIEVDHVNRDGLDCRRSNLRRATRAQNAQNTRRTGWQSEFRGLGTSRNRWYAVLEAEGERYRSRVFDSEVEAAKAYDVLSRAFHGEFGIRNFPDEPDAYTLDQVLDLRSGWMPRKGEAHPNARLTEDDIRAIRRRVAAGEKKILIAAEFGVVPSAITAIIKKRVWTHVEDEAA